MGLKKAHKCVGASWCMWSVYLGLAISCAGRLTVAAPPEEFPKFVVPGHEAEMSSLRDLFWLHYQIAGPQIPLWDEWLPNATLWPAVGSGPKLDGMRQRWAHALASRVIDADGYVATQQHDGPAHAEGWPFPTWMQAGGVGWHFRPIGVAGYEAPPATTKDWKLSGAVDKGLGAKGWQFDLNGGPATLETPPFAIDAHLFPFLRLNCWATGLEHTKCYIEWTTKNEPEFGANRRVYFDSPPDASFEQPRELRIMIPVSRQPEWKGTITRLRIGFEHADRGQLIVKSFHVACDTRQNVNNLNFIRGCHDYFLWTDDIEFLRGQMPRIRTAMRFVDREFQTHAKKCIYTTWPGHEGRSGVRYVNGQKQIVVGQGIGSNYWDLLPFGGEDALATVYYYDTLRKLAELESLVAAHPDWKVASDGAFNSQELLTFADEVRKQFQARFWNPATGRFGTIDLDGNLHDYGFTFLNNEAVVFGVASPEQARSICDWIGGRRTVAGDTSTGDDIYHWRFGPRTTTLRNVDYYYWSWSDPQSIPWGYQVQDGGAVLGWTYYDLMAQLKTAGPAVAAARLAEIAKWFDDTQREGGYRAYYAKNPTRGSLQGGNSAGGLGLDKEFIESVLAPQVMLYGFLGFHPTYDGFEIAPQLPKDWPELTVTRVHLHDRVLNVSVDSKGALRIDGDDSTGSEIVVHAPASIRLTSTNGIKARLATGP
ncbi:MAG TPA: glycosyl hydrolase family 65 protein [Lacipirellulaceae bacterium]|nr:glycosyl hydrolase family 65 protein [Lacipirellulaceae bacterium]